MRTAALILLLSFGGLQTVRYTNCGCPDVCARKGAPYESGCGNCDRPEDRGDCCGQDQEKESTPSGCVHLEPFHDVTSHAPSVDVVPPVGIIHLVAPDVLKPLEEPSAEDLFTPARPARGRPLFLLLSSLLI